MVIAGFCATGAHPAAAHVAAAITVKYFLFTTVSWPQGIRRGADTMPERVTEKRRSNDDATQQSCYTACYRFAPLGKRSSAGRYPQFAYPAAPREDAACIAAKRSLAA